MNENQQSKFQKLVNKVLSPPHGGLATRMNNRFQERPWYVKLWRYRWYLRVPYDTLRYWKTGRFHNGDLGLCYSMAMGEAHYRMNWLYTLEEVRKLAENKRKK